MRIADKNKVKKIIEIFKKHPEGTYISEISKETGLAKSTVNYLLDAKFKDNIEIIKMGEKGLFKIIKLKQ